MINIEDIKKTKSPSIRVGVTEYYRNAILTEKLKPGDVLPSSRELANSLNTSYPNIHYALTPLVKEGLITRDRKAGTIVLARERKIKCIVIYVCITTLDDAGPFQHTLTDIISDKLKKMNIESRLIVDSTSHYGLMQIKKWAEQGEIQGVIIPRSYHEKAITAVLKSLPVPVTFPGDANSVFIDWSNLNELAIKGLKRQGCKNVGIISSIEHYNDTKEEDPFYIDFKKKVSEFDLNTKLEWIEATVSKENYLRTSEMAISFAFEACDRILNLPERPDGLFIFSDNLIAGVMMAIMKNNMNTPNDIKLVLHRNWEIKIPLFRPCVVVGLSITDIANALIDNIFTRSKGIKTKKVKVKYEIRDFNISGDMND